MSAVNFKKIVDSNWVQYLSAIHCNFIQNIVIECNRVQLSTVECNIVQLEFSWVQQSAIEIQLSAIIIQLSAIVIQLSAIVIQLSAILFFVDFQPLWDLLSWFGAKTRTTCQVPRHPGHLLICCFFYVWHNFKVTFVMQKLC